MNQGVAVAAIVRLIGTILVLSMALLLAIVGDLVQQGNQAAGLTIIIAMIVGAVGVLMIRGCFQTPSAPPSKE